MAPYARLEVTLIVLAGGLLTAACAWLWHAWAILPAVITLALLLFYRDPPRHAPHDERAILAPADGRIVEIARPAEQAGGPDVIRIMIFLSVFDVHINRSPCAGRVERVDYRPGRFLNALSAAADAQNECNTVTLSPRVPLPGPVTVRQIAGVLARRIVCAVGPGDALTAGQRIGMIKLGSRTEICLPDDPHWRIAVQRGDHVRAGVTVLATLDDRATS